MYILLSSEHTVYKVKTRTLKQSSNTEKVSAELYFQHRRYMPESIVFEQSQYITTAAYAALNKLDWQQSFGAEIRLEANTGKEISFQSNSSSAGLGYALALALEWRKQLNKSSDVLLDIFATGEVHASGRVNAVGHIETKVKTALNTVQQHLVEGVVKPFVIFYPAANDHDISDKLKDNVKKLGGELVAVERLQSALFYLLGEEYDGDIANRFEPFKGLESFNFEDRFRFFGRDNALKKLISEFECTEGLFVVTGVSGAGKSSIVKAGLLPHIQDHTVEKIEFKYKIIPIKQQSLEELLLSLVNFLLPEQIQVDGYQAYAQTKVTLVGCWAHARRKFIEAKQVQGKNKSGKADMALSSIQKLYGIEAKLKGKTPEAKYEARQQQAKPFIEMLHDWLIKQHVLPKTKLAEAITYLNNQWHKLIRYLESGQLNIDNNRAERAIKPFVIGRKAWLFSQTANGQRCRC